MEKEEPFLEIHLFSLLTDICIHGERDKKKMDRPSSGWLRPTCVFGKSHPKQIAM